MKTYPFLLMILAFLGIMDKLPARELRLDHVEHLTLDDGLAHNLVWDIEQDRTGFLWIATNNGLQRFDGYEIVTYKNDGDDPDSLAHNWVRQVFEDRAGVLWVATYGGGLERFDQVQERFVHHRHDPDDPRSLADDRVRVIYEAPDETLWVGGIDALHRFDRRDATFTRYRHDPDHPASWNPVTVNAVLVDHRGELWVGTDRGLYRSAAGAAGLVRGDFIHDRYDPTDASSLSHDRVRVIHEDSQGRIWLGTEGGLDRFEPSDGSFVRLRHDATVPPERRPDLVRAIFEGTSGDLWVGTEGGGLLHRVAESELFRRYQADPEDPNGLSSSSIFSIHQDRTGVLWLGSRAGLDKIDRRRERFKVLRRRPAELGGLSGNMVWGFTEDRNGTLWVGTRDGGLAAVDRAAGTAVHYRSDPEDPQSLPHDYVSDVVEDPQGQLWIGTEGGLCRVDQAADSVPWGGSKGGKHSIFHYRHDPTDPQGLRSDRIYSLLADSRGSVWIATRSSGIQRVDPPTAERPRERFVTYLHDPDNVTTMSDDEAYGFYEDRSGEIWVASVSGLNRFDRASETFERIQHDPTDPNSLSRTDITSLVEDEDGIFWIGTYGGGVNRWDRERGEFRHYREKDGLPSDNVSSLLLDDLGQLWIAAGPGLTRFDPRDESFRYYNKEDGLHGKSFAIGSAMKSATGELIFGGPGGITTFFPEDIIDDPEPPAVVFTDFRLAGETAPLVRHDPSSPLAAAVTHAEEIVLTHEHKVFAFEFAALHYSSPHHHQYAYRLEGFDDDWITTEASQRYAQYTNLDPGKYVFRVKASNQDGIWNEDGASIPIKVLPPWWRTLPAYTLYLGLLIIAYQLRTRNIRAHNRELQAEIDARQRLAAERGQLLEELEAARVLESRFQVLDQLAAHDPRGESASLAHHLARQDRFFVKLLRSDSPAHLAALRDELREIETMSRQSESTSSFLPAGFFADLRRMLEVLSSLEQMPSSEDRAFALGQALTRALEMQERLTGDDNTEPVLGGMALETMREIFSTALRATQQSADIKLELRSKQVKAHRDIMVVLEIRNVGRGNARNLVVDLAVDTSVLQVARPRQHLKNLLRGQSARLEFRAIARRYERVRLAFHITWDDLDDRGKEFDFADVMELSRYRAPKCFQSLQPNPYIVGRPLLGPDLFFGREDLFKQISMSFEGSSQDNALVLVGQRRMGKTSILRRLRRHLPESYVPVIVDLQGFFSPGESAFFIDLAGRIVDDLEEIGIAINEPETQCFEQNPGNVFRRRFLVDVIGALKGRRLLLVFDEMEVLEERIRAGELTPRILPYIRSLIQSESKISFMLAGTHRLDELEANQWGMLLDLAIYINVGHLEEADISKLLQEPTSGYFEMDSLAVEKTFRATGGHPHFSQLLARELVEYCNRRKLSYVTVQDVSQVIDSVVDKGQLHIAYLWNEASRAERMLLLAIREIQNREGLVSLEAAGRYLDKRHLEAGNLAAAARRLRRKEILAEDAGQLSFRIDLLRYWLDRHQGPESWVLSQERGA